jgi:CRISPR-associated protein Csm3
MYGKIKISADITVLTGMHIGSSNIYSAIGAVDAPVFRDALTKDPVIPGSSLKGKLRTLLARSMSDSYILPEPNEDKEEIKRLFGSSAKPIIKSRLQFSDSFLKNKDELKEVGLTEVKFENRINRITSEANPRQIERAIRGSIFEFVLIYDIEQNGEIIEDFDNLAKAFKLLQMDYLGGHGTRGYGKVKFSNFNVSAIDEDFDTGILEKLQDILKEVEKYELLSLQA